MSGSNLVNLDHIKEIIPTPSGDARIVMESGDHIGMSRRYRDRLKPLEI
ncbi:MAG: LytTR family transcriptional regulator DNA-binding domain-containing protein [Proteobacteria bacterium]|nr:LytTR family transcriptional regulator DNA-binding domain-containing protein [Pseudomonadota bacterium]